MLTLIRYFRWFCLLLTVLAASATSAKELEYDIYWEDIKIGAFDFDFASRDDVYSAVANVEMTGIMGAIFQTNLHAEGKGVTTQFRNLRPVIGKYEIKQVRDISGRELEYNIAGAPKVKFTGKARAKPTDLKAALQIGTVDPLTALSYMFRVDLPQRICNRRATIFDGRVLVELIMDTPEQIEPNVFRCRGAFRKLDGFRDEDMAKGRSFNFVAIYAPVSTKGYSIVQFLGKSPYGNYTLKRK